VTLDLSAAAGAKPSDRAITQDLMARLQRHYIKPGVPFAGGVFLPEVGWNGGVGTTRCDAIYVGFTGTSGRLLIGHEVKASRSDWLNELKKPGKADAWADECHEWWLVAAPGIVHDGELPDGWGLMVPGRSTTRLQVQVRAQRNRDRTPSWDAVRSIMARQDTLRAGAIADARSQAQIDARAEFQERLDREVDRQMGAGSRGSVAELRAELERIRKALGVESVAAAGEIEWGKHVTESTLADVAQLLRHHRNLAEAAHALVGRYSPPGIDRLRAALDEVERARADVAAAIKDQTAVGE
jgi:hypothetical protein